MSDYQVLVHYHNPTDDYLSYNIWQWQENQIGKETSFSNFDYFGRSGLVTYQSETNLDYVHLIIKKQTGRARPLIIPFVSCRLTWLQKFGFEGDHQVYYSRQAAITSHYTNTEILTLLIWRFLPRNLTVTGAIREV